MEDLQQKGGSLIFWMRVLPKYKYASLAELKCCLKLYNLTADRGKEEGIIFKKNGLVYRVLDEQEIRSAFRLKRVLFTISPRYLFCRKSLRKMNCKART
jgi:hypothetical protein